MADDLHYTGFDDTPRDAPTSKEDVRPLVTLGMLNTQNQQVHLPVTVAVSNTYVKISMNLLVGMEKQDLRCVHNIHN